MGGDVLKNNGRLIGPTCYVYLVVRFFFVFKQKEPDSADINERKSQVGLRYVTGISIDATNVPLTWSYRLISAGRNADDWCSPDKCFNILFIVSGRIE